MDCTIPPAKGEGGALSDYKETIGKNIAYGEDIRPFVDDLEALAWACEKLDVEVIETHFAEHLEEA